MEKTTTFSPREWDVFVELQLGKTNKEIGRLLGISEKTVKANVTQILRKTLARNRTQAAILKQNDYAHLIPRSGHNRKMNARPYLSTIEEAGIDISLPGPSL